MKPEETQAERLKQAVTWAIHDRRSSWHARCLPLEEMPVEEIEAALSDEDGWQTIVEQDVAREYEAKAGNGRMYRLSILPIRHFAIRYYAVMCFARYAPGLWHSRLGSDYLSCSGTCSLFLGRVRENTLAYKDWQICQESRYVLKFDVRAFYPSIRHDVLIKQLTSRCSGGDAETQRMLRLLPCLLRYPSSTGAEIKHCETGLPIGNTSERFFSNLYLEPLDEYLLGQTDVASCRRLDDIRVFGSNRTRMEEIREALTALAARLGLTENSEKTRVVVR